MQHEKRSYQPIENYGIIGNLQTVALVSLRGSIDFMCCPRFDSPTVFASLLDAKKGGYFSIEPVMKDYKSKQLYLPGTAVLLTRFFADAGIAEISDYMPLTDHYEEHCGCIIRKIKTIRGNITYRMHCAPRFDYARTPHEAQQQGSSIAFTAGAPHLPKLRLLAEVPLEVRGADGYAEFTVSENDSVHIVLESFTGDIQQQPDIKDYVQHTYIDTIDSWRKWCRQITYDGRYTELVQRSAITLKLLSSGQYGSVIAAATFGLPETMGGHRNWDYRYAWIRDAAFTMYAFLRLGLYEEAHHFLEWVFNLCKERKLQLIYRVDGNTTLDERELPHLDGYRGSRPVRIGNAAKDQLQVDIYGELIDTIYIYNKSYKPISYEFWTMICTLVECVTEQWNCNDHGIWEIRSDKLPFLHTRLMCWVAMDRAIKIAEHRVFPYPEQEWKSLRDAIYNDIYHNFWNGEVQAWVQFKGSDLLDASVLLMPLTHFIAPMEPRWTKTMEALDKKLRLDVLLYRYQGSDKRIDGLEGEEGTFNMCSFWYIEALAKSGQISKAVENFEKMLGYANHLGLFSEELGHTGEHLGNFPQAFTHLALISAALELDKQLKRLR